MDSVCDLFLNTPTSSRDLRYINILDKSFLYQTDAIYSGYLGVSVNRVKLIPLINLLKKQGVSVYSVPLNYKEASQISKEKAFKIAGNHASLHGLKVCFDSSMRQNDNPLIWVFDVISLAEEKAGGVVMIDRLDGHVWSLDDLETYMYDYNNVC